MKTAIALCGGGSKGSYEMGAWQALRELNIEYDIVTGTSIGAINGALMAQRDYHIADALWSTITVDQVMHGGIDFQPSIDAMYHHRDQLLTFLKKYINEKGADIAPLKNTLHKIIDETRLRQSDIQLGVVCVRFPSLKPLEISIDAMAPGQAAEYVLASASCFPAFPLCKIGETNYIDGGYYDKLPIDFAFRLGAKRVIAIDLHAEPPTHPKFIGLPNVYYIHPSWDLGSFLCFDREILERNRTLGYNDTKKAFARMHGYRYSFAAVGASADSLGCAFLSDITLLESSARSHALSRSAGEETVADLCNCLQQYTDAQPLAFSQYWLRACEICAELFAVDPLPIYEDSMRLGRSLLEIVESLEEIPTARRLSMGRLPLTRRLPKRQKATAKKLPPAHRVARFLRVLLVSKGHVDSLAPFVREYPSEVIAALFLYHIDVACTAMDIE